MAYQKTIQYTIDNTCASCSVLEIGCGTGIITIEVSPHVESILATDISEKMIETAKEKALITGQDNITFKVADAYNLNLQSLQFDTVLVYNILHLLKKPDSFIEEIKKYLKPKGKIFIAVDCMNEGNTRKDKNIRLMYKFVSSLRIIPHITFYSINSLKRLMERHGFTTIKEEIIHPKPVNYFMIAERQ